MSRYLVGNVSEIPPGSRKIIEANGRSIGVFNVKGEFYAIRNTCPHQGAALCEGLVTSLVMSPLPGEFTYEMEGEIVRCPWHFWEFDIKTGCMIVDPKTKTKKYDVTVEKNASTIEKNDPTVEKNDITVERYDVTVEEEKVFVEV